MKDLKPGRNITEEFSYDGLDRLTTIKTSTENSISYSTNGNITSKYDAGNYQYNASQPHAVTLVMPFAGQTPMPAAQQDVEYTPYNKVERINEGGKELVITYGFDKLRRKSELTVPGITGTRVRYYFGNYEEEWPAAGGVRKIHYIYGGDGLAAIYIINNGTGTMYYVLNDYQGNIMALTNQSGAIVEEYSYDAWGRRRNPNNPDDYNVSTPSLIYRGYTAHEHLDEFGLINMNGRVYDPITARFLSPDIVVQAPLSTQNYNRYTYCLNNPLKYTDPTGYYMSPSQEWALEIQMQEFMRAPDYDNPICQTPEFAFAQMDKFLAECEYDDYIHSNQYLYDNDWVDLSIDFTSGTIWTSDESEYSFSMGFDTDGNFYNEYSYNGFSYRTLQNDNPFIGTMNPYDKNTSDLISKELQPKINSALAKEYSRLYDQTYDSEPSLTPYISPVNFNVSKKGIMREGFKYTFNLNDKSFTIGGVYTPASNSIVRRLKYGKLPDYNAGNEGAIYWGVIFYTQGSVQVANLVFPNEKLYKAFADEYIYPY